MSRLTLPCFEHLAYILLNSSVLANRLSTCTRYSVRVPENNDDRIPTEEHLAYEPVFVHRKSLLLAFTGLWHL